MKRFLVKTQQMNTVMTQPIVREAKIAPISVKTDVWQKRDRGVHLEYQVHKVRKVSKDTQGWKGFLGQRETRENLDKLAPKETRERLDESALREKREILDTM